MRIHFGFHGGNWQLDQDFPANIEFFLDMWSFLSRLTKKTGLVEVSRD